MVVPVTVVVTIVGFLVNLLVIVVLALVGLAMVVVVKVRAVVCKWCWLTPLMVGCHGSWSSFNKMKQTFKTLHKKQAFKHQCV